MRIKIDNDKSSMDILEVKTVWSDEDASKLLASGEWRLLHGGVAHMDDLGYRAKSVYILGRVK